MILFDTSASQTGPYRDTSFAALEACIAKLRPEDRVQLLAVDFEARPITEQFVAAGSPELKAAIEKLHGESPLGSTDMESVMRTTATRFDPAEQGESCCHLHWRRHEHGQFDWDAGIWRSCEAVAIGACTGQQLRDRAAARQFALGRSGQSDGRQSVH